MVGHPESASAAKGGHVRFDPRKWLCRKTNANSSLLTAGKTLTRLRGRIERELDAG